MLIETFLKNPSSVTGRISQVCIQVYITVDTVKSAEMTCQRGFRYYFSWSQAAFLNNVAESILRNMK